MLLRSGRRKPYEVSVRGRQSAKRKRQLRSVKTASGESGNSLLSGRYVCNLGKMIPVQGRSQPN